ncbi:MAG: GNAT family N-acetyltransferase [Candidatus Marinimicrobia bacterium]|nr:GNAT family N-acetyltransferase [Candidatus Neomarinimicrobiota bacterium]
MSISLRTYTVTDTQAWEAFVAAANNGTLFHERKFLGYHPQDRFLDHSLILEKSGKLKALFPAVDVNSGGKRSLVSHQGSSYGGIVVCEDLSFRDSYDFVETIVEYAQTAGFERIQMTLPPAIYQRRVSNYLDFSLIKHGFSYKKRDVSSMLTIEAAPEKNLERFSATHRTAVRKAIKQGVSIRQSEDWSDFYDLLRDNLKIRHNVQPTHSLAELLKLRSLYPDRIRLFGAYWEDQLIAGVVNFSVNQDVVLAFYISHKEAFQHLRAVNLLFYEIVTWCHAHNFKYLDFGIFTVDMDPNFGLGRFKENFGASGVFRDTFELNF